MPELVSGLTSTDEERLEQAEALVRAYCGWHIAPSRADETVTINSNGSDKIMLPSLYVTAVSSVVVDSTTTLVAGQDYTWETWGEVLLSSRLWVSRYGWPLASVVVTFTHGYADAPFELTPIIQSLASRAIDSPGTLTQVGQVRYATGPDGTALGMSLTQGEKDALAPYRIPAMA
jgi:hypothetical protein